MINSHKLEPLLIGQRDFECIGQVAQHCDWDKLCIYIREQQNLSLLPKIGFCLFDLLMKQDLGFCISGGYEGTDILRHLFNGGRYRGCDGTTKMHFGLKRSLVHWAYGAYIYRHGIVDTPFGAVQKLNQDSVPVEMSVLKSLNLEHRNDAENYFEMTMDYLCSVKDCEPISECDICECISGCKCSYCHNIGKSKTLQRRGVSFSNISKYE